jgi:dipeptidyl aminopeptidase/acylaminoacyl peptidase
LSLPAGEPKKLAHKEGDVRGLTWTADGSRICFSLDSQIQIISVSGGDTVSLGNGFSPSIRREGRALVYTRSLLMENIWRAPGPASKAGPVERFISSSEVDGMPHFSPDGERIAFISNRMGSVEVWLCNSDGTDPTQLTSLDKDSASRPRWSPDGQQILFTVWHETGGDTWVVDADGIRPHPLISGPSNDILASWSRDGQWVYFTSNRTDRQEIWKIPAAGGEAEQVTTNGGAEPFESHDERLLYYVKRLGEGRVWKVPVGGGEERQVIDARVEVLNWALWDDGICRINFDRPEGPVIEYINLETQQVRDLARLDEKAVPNRYQGNGICVSPDGRWVLYGQNDFPFEDLMIVEDFF